jgi:hyperosmotically inducible periplasmic protein
MFRTFSGKAGAALMVSLTIVSVAPAALAQQSRPDNTQVNKRDRAAAQPTADQQSNTKSDVAITRDIRRAIVNDKSLSTYAHNIKVITQHGDVTLKGPVLTDEEKKIVEAKATEVAGAGHVTNAISITSAPPKARAKAKK